MTRPEPHEAPDGFEYVAVPDAHWRIASGKRCRASGQRGRSRCPNDCVAELNRSGWRDGAAPRWWAYCSEHMYGRWIEDGKVVHYVLRPVEEVPS